MKNIILALTALLIFNCCDKKDDEPKNPIDQLPPATQIGANTAGCLVNGEAIFPKGSGLIFQIFYTNGLNFGLFIANEKANNDRIINLASLNESLQVGQTYQLKEYAENSKYGEYVIRDFPISETQYQTTATVTGELKITHHDFNNAIISGTFWFDAIDSEGNIVEVREGRFDGEY
ncbi:DUF6252 family protein [Mariniflexile sp.]|uniref:DUF6252 family protein n=1 Tax=Mariniflexile sp. TaxID=1979402 RepID=UPI003566DC1A